MVLSVDLGSTKYLKYITALSLLDLNLVIIKSPKSKHNTRQEQTDRPGFYDYETYDVCFILHIGLLMILSPENLKVPNYNESTFLLWDQNIVEEKNG